MGPLAEIGVGAVELGAKGIELGAELAAEAAEVTAEGALAAENGILESATTFEQGVLDGIENTTSTINTDTNYVFENSIKPSVEEFISSQDPENFLGQLSNMSDAELDATIVEIEKGDLDMVENRFGAPNEAMPTEMPVEAPLEAPGIIESIDEPRFDYLKSIIELPELETTVEEAPLLAPQETVVEAPELAEESVEEIAPVDSLAPTFLREKQTKSLREKIQPEIKTAIATETIESREAMRKEKYGGAVIYDIEDTEPLANMRIVLAQDTYTGLWTLPEVPLEGKKTEEKETEHKIETYSEINIDMEQQLDRKKDKIESSDGSTAEVESVYFLAGSDSEEPIKEGLNLQWFTLQDLISLKIPLYEHVLGLIDKSVDVIKERREKKEQNRL